MRKILIIKIEIENKMFILFFKYDCLLYFFNLNPI